MLARYANSLPNSADELQGKGSGPNNRVLRIDSEPASLFLVDPELPREGSHLSRFRLSPIMSNPPIQRPNVARTAVVQEGVLIGTSTFIGEFSFVRSGTEIGDGCVIGSFVGIEAFVRIGGFTSIQSRCHLTSGLVIGESCFFGPGVITMNDRTMAHGRPSVPFQLTAPVVERGARIGGGALLLPGSIVKENAFVYAGSVISGTVGPGQIVAGNPARPIGVVPRSEWL